MKKIKEFLRSGILKSFGIYMIIISSLVGGFYIGRITYKFQGVEIKKSENPYINILNPEEISIAVNENNELLLIDRKTGIYTVYSDELGRIIFKLYSNRIYQDIN